MEEEDNSIVKSKYDHRDYRVITMKNGLQALLVHDPTVATKGGSKKEAGQSAAASMVVGVGALHAREYSPGLPHLLEHMIGEGSEKFSPDYETYISRHNGSANAFTTPEYTCYHFEVNGIYLKNALKRFADCFIAPLLARKTIKAEVEAVDDEFNGTKRKWKFIYHGLLCHTFIEGHPYNGIFHCGNRRSLLGEEVNKVDYDRLHKELLKFHKKYYIGKLMKLVVIGGESLDELQGWIEKLFKSIKRCPVKKKLSITPLPSKQYSMWKGYFGTHIQSKKRKRSPERSNPPESLPNRPIWKSGQIFRICLENQNPDILLVSWRLPPLRKKYEYKADIYISYFLNKKGNGSLFSLLKDKGWVENLIAGIDKGGICSTSMAEIFTIEIHLTMSGSSQINNIIGLIYEYLMLIRDSPPELIYKEIQCIGELQFNFRVENNQVDYAIDLSENLLLYPQEHVICANYWYAKWSQPTIKEVLDYLVPKYMRIDVFSDFAETEESECLPWFQIQYSVEDIAKSYMELWEQTREAHEPLQLPCRNEFIPNNTCTSDEAFSNMISPECIYDKELMKLWYKRDCRFKVPSSSVYIRLTYSKGVWDNVKHHVLSDLFVALLYDKLDEVIYMAEEAMFKITLGFIDGMLEVKVFGLNEMLPSLLSEILSEVIYFMPTDGSKFEVIKGDVRRKLTKGVDEELLESLLCEDNHGHHDKLTTLYDLSLNDVRGFIEDIRSQIFIEGLVHGNLSKGDAINISKIFEQILPEKSPPTLLRHVRRVTCLTPNTNFVENRLSENMSSAELFVQIGENLFNSINLMALLDLFEVIVKKPFYDRLRTKEKLGYTVLSHSSETQNVWGFHFYIQSSSHKPYYMQQRIEKFLIRFEKTLKNLNNKKFKKYKTSLVDKKLQGCSSLEKESERVWKEMTKYSHEYNIAQKVASELENIEKNDLMEFYRNYFKKSSPCYKQLKINGWSSEKPREAGDFDPDEVNFRKFKSGDFDPDDENFDEDPDEVNFDEEFKSGDFDPDEMSFHEKLMYGGFDPNEI